MRIARHEGLGKKIKAGAVDDHPGSADGIDKRSSRRIAHHIDAAAFGAIHERLAHIAVDDQFSSFYDLAQLILCIAVHRDRQPVNAGGKIIAAAAVNIYCHIIGFRAQVRSRYIAGRCN